MKKYTILFALIACSLLQWGCEDMLEVKPYSELSDDAMLTDNGIRALLNSCYRNMQQSTPSRWQINVAEVTTDIGYNTGGQENLQMTQLINFTWDATLGTFNDDHWAPWYRAIRDANIILELAPKATLSEENRALYTAEARMLRGYAYAMLYNLFGSVPLRTTSESPAQLARASDDEMRSFIESELTAVVPALPDPGAEAAYGRANKGQALAVLAKYYLNTRQWQKAADAAQDVIDLGYYGLFDNFEEMFLVKNEGDKNKDNKEMILVIPCLNQDPYGNWYQAGALPPDFASSAQFPDFQYKAGMSRFATNYRMRSAFVNSYGATDVRAKLIMTEYVNEKGVTVDLMTQANNARSMKYYDNETSGNHSGNDVPVIRYADILLTRAEALNEADGPTQEALDLINEVRGRAGIAELTLADAPDKETLRNLILQERAWEFAAEGKRREDLLRHDRFISTAQSLGIAIAADKHKLFPFPQRERDTNKISGQNPDYETIQ
ncbi:RagB/SusD family nutrient uptake outer membrane protein [Dawidia soli]|uniref:RagB/SusD family nutrient uptake outer membrane protein n=1 Tax=Dawidia soli TaxID=2782352 RepID=A0AAP2DFJ1_9BACT|nr:RagB/SusD family nutrient uptake outer membrane protein [Dawidia soli]MBT1689850.1 RagB/SusD family nutrient uptake outer membrane protein [Dawidia soli]